MSGIFWEISKRNIRIHLLRSFLAMLGIVIGVVAISSMGILGNSMVLSVSDSLRTVGDSVIVTPHAGSGAKSVNPTRATRPAMPPQRRIFERIKTGPYWFEGPNEP